MLNFKMIRSILVALCIVLFRSALCANVDFEALYNEVKPNVNDTNISIASILAARQGGSSSSPEICREKSDSSIFVYGKCSDECLPLLNAFRECGPKIQFGCDLESCGDGTFRCTLQPELITDNIVCPGDKVVFDSIDIKRLEKLSYSVDLRASPSQTDFYLLSDATSSMSTAIATAKLRANDIINIFGKRPNVAFGVGMYRDEEELSMGFMNLQSIIQTSDSKGVPIATNVNQVKQAINRLVPSGGKDRDEANLVALYKVATDKTIGWREKSRKILVYFGDFPGHEPSCVIPGLTITRRNVISALVARRITVIAVNFKGLNLAPTSFRCGAGSPRAGPGQAKDITVETAGVEVPSSDQAQLVKAIMKGVEGLPRDFDVDETACAPFLESTHVPSLPRKVLPGAIETVQNFFTIKPTVCLSGNKFECSYRYTESGADLPMVNVEFVNIRGC